MKYIRFILLPVVLCVSMLPAQAEKLSLRALSDYLNGLHLAQAEFTQINEDGTISTGQMLMQRPGRVRFEYNPPEESLVIASAGKIAVFDSKSNQPPEQFPLKRTPLNLILARTVDLGQAKMVVGHTADETTTSVIAQDPENPEYGSIELVFSENPIALRQWIIKDSAGQTTTVILGELNVGKPVPASAFNIIREVEKRGLN